MNYHEALRIAKTARSYENGKPLGANLRICEGCDGKVLLRHHSTYIITYYDCGSIILNNGGWYSVTTKKIMNKYLPKGINLFQKKHKWYIEVNKQIFDYENGMNVANFITLLLNNEITS